MRLSPFPEANTKHDTVWHRLKNDDTSIIKGNGGHNNKRIRFTADA